MDVAVGAVEATTVEEMEGGEREEIKMQGGFKEEGAKGDFG